MLASSASREIHISAMLAERITAGDFPSAVYLISEKGRTVFVDALGQAVVIRIASVPLLILFTISLR